MVLLEALIVTGDVSAPDSFDAAADERATAMSSFPRSTPVAPERSEMPSSDIPRPIKRVEAGVAIWAEVAETVFAERRA
jgi:hypothetical protein